MTGLSPSGVLMGQPCCSVSDFIRVSFLVGCLSVSWTQWFRGGKGGGAGGKEWGSGLAGGLAGAHEVG